MTSIEYINESMEMNSECRFRKSANTNFELCPAGYHFLTIQNENEKNLVYEYIYETKRKLINSMNWHFSVLCLKSIKSSIPLFSDAPYEQYVPIDGKYNFLRNEWESFNGEVINSNFLEKNWADGEPDHQDTILIGVNRNFKMTINHAKSNERAYVLCI